MGIRFGEADHPGPAASGEMLDLIFLSNFEEWSLEPQPEIPKQMAAKRVKPQQRCWPCGRPGHLQRPFSGVRVGEASHPGPISGAPTTVELMLFENWMLDPANSQAIAQGRENVIAKCRTNCRVTWHEGRIFWFR